MRQMLFVSKSLMRNLVDFDLRHKSASGKQAVLQWSRDSRLRENGRLVKNNTIKPSYVVDYVNHKCMRL